MHPTDPNQSQAPLIPERDPVEIVNICGEPTRSMARGRDLA